VAKTEAVNANATRMDIVTMIRGSGMGWGIRCWECCVCWMLGIDACEDSMSSEGASYTRSSTGGTVASKLGRTKAAVLRQVEVENNATQCPLLSVAVWSAVASRHKARGVCALWVGCICVCFVPANRTPRGLCGVYLVRNAHPPLHGGTCAASKHGETSGSR
jgi:hypothetical protein